MLKSVATYGLILVCMIMYLELRGKGMHMHPQRSSMQFTYHGSKPSQTKHIPEKNDNNYNFDNVIHIPETTTSLATVSLTQNANSSFTCPPPVKCTNPGAVCMRNFRQGYLGNDFMMLEGALIEAVKLEVCAIVIFPQNWQSQRAFGKDSIMNMTDLGPSWEQGKLLTWGTQADQPIPETVCIYMYLYILYIYIYVCVYMCFCL